MGLDMYFRAKQYLSDYVDTDKEIKTQISEIVKGFNTEWSVKEITYEVGYWRKANAIHNWFVQNVQDGEDDCKEYYVTSESIIELYNTILECLEGGIDVAVEKLPPQEGFFFGSTTIDEWYWQDLEDTKRMLEPLVNAFKEAEEMGVDAYKHPVFRFDYYYQSSW